MTNKEFCARLRKAKKLAVRRYPNSWCIYDGCYKAGLILGVDAIFEFDEGSNTSSFWVQRVARSKKDIAAVFDNSIRNLGEEP